MSEARQSIHMLRNAINSMRLAATLLSDADLHDALELLELIERQASDAESAVDALLAAWLDVAPAR